MQNKILVFALRLMGVAIILLSSCKKYLDVQPEDKFLENSVYSDGNSIRNALNGIYLNLAKPQTYSSGSNSTPLDVPAMLDILAQYYNISSSSHRLFQIAQYKYTDAAVMNYMGATWGSRYMAVLNLNLFIQHLESDSSIVSAAERKLMLGEAYGLRAFTAFDLLRLFGPVYITDSLKTAIPYPSSPKPDIQPLLPANQVVLKVLADLAQASVLLQNDPVRTKGARAADLGGDAYFSLRNRRMNYFAVRALTAMVLLYQRDFPDAASVANAVISEAGALFPWSPATLSAPGIASPDRIFSSEMIFGLEDIDLYTMQTEWFAASNTDYKILMPLPGRLESIYENNPNDYRYRSWFAIDQASNRINKTFFKYADVKDPNQLFRRMLPMIRMSEMYYIAAECASDEGGCTRLLNIVRANRGLPPVTLNGNRQEQINREYAKEFWGEGQLFFYYKRLNQSVINSGSQDGGSVNMSNAQYVVPLPLSETSFR